MLCEAAHFGLDDLEELAVEGLSDPAIFDQFVILEKVRKGFFGAYESLFWVPCIRIIPLFG